MECTKFYKLMIFSYKLIVALIIHSKRITLWNLKNDPHVQFIHCNGSTLHAYLKILIFLTSSISSRLTLGDNALIRACLFDVLLATDSLPLVAPWDKSFLLFSFSTRDISPLWVKTNNLVMEQIIQQMKLSVSSKITIAYCRILREEI